MAVTVARLEAVLSAQTRNFDRAMDRSESKTKKMGVAAGVAGAAIFAGLGVLAARGFSEIAESQKVMAQTEAGIKSTGGVAKVTAGDITRLANRMSRLSGIDDEVIQQGANLLLTFTRVHNEVGRGNNIFDRATQSALDLSVKGFGSMDSTSKMLGKALQDPVKGMTALGRAGVTFTAAQKDTIKALVESGDLLGAQKLILKEVETQVGGSAKAYGETLPGQMAKARNSFDEMSAQLMTALLPALTAVMEQLSELVGWLTKHPTAAKAMAVALGVLALGLMGVSLATSLVAVGATLMWAALTAGLIIAIPALIAGFVILYNKSETFRDVVSAAMDAVMVVISGLVWYFEHTWKPIITTALNAVKLIFGWFRDNSSSIWNGVKSAVTTMATPVKDAFNNVKTAINAVQDFFIWFRDSGGGFWDGLKGTINTAIDLIRDAFDGARDKVNKVQDLFIWFRDSGGSAIQTMWNAAKAPLGFVEDAFKDIWGWLKKVKDGIAWLIEKIPSIPKLPDIPLIGSEMGKNPPGGTGVSGGLAGAIALGNSMGLRMSSGLRPGDPGDHGKGKAIDMSGGASAMARFANAMFGSGKDVIYGNLPFWQDNGRMVRGWFGNEALRADHYDHVHYSVFDKGGWLKPGLTLAYNGTGAPERVGGGGVNIYLTNNGVLGHKSQVVDWLRNAAAEFERRNSRPAFG